jgi:hypothetical protein
MWLIGLNHAAPDVWHDGHDPRNVFCKNQSYASRDEGVARIVACEFAGRKINDVKIINKIKYLCCIE